MVLPEMAGDSRVCVAREQRKYRSHFSSSTPSTSPHATVDRENNDKTAAAAKFPGGSRGISRFPQRGRTFPIAQS